MLSYLQSIFLAVLVTLSIGKPTIRNQLVLFIAGGCVNPGFYLYIY